MRSLHLNKACSSGMLRLSLHTDPQVDPGFFLLWSSIRDFRRLLGTQDEVLSDWKVFMSRLLGTATPGHFYRILHLFLLIGWTVLTPPRFVDHEDLVHDLLHIPEDLLARLAKHGWLQHVSDCHRQRKNMHDLQGIESTLLNLDCARLTPLDSARLAAIHSGAFTSPEQHARFDLSKTSLRLVCARFAVSGTRSGIEFATAHDSSPLDGDTVGSTTSGTRYLPV